jgi:hypothetical protein
MNNHERSTFDDLRNYIQRRRSRANHQKEERRRQVARNRESIKRQVDCLVEYNVGGFLRRAADEAALTQQPLWEDLLSGKRCQQEIVEPNPEEGITPVACVLVWDYKYERDGEKWIKTAKGVSCRVKLDNQSQPIGLLISGINESLSFPTDKDPTAMDTFYHKLEGGIVRAMMRMIENEPYHFGGGFNWQYIPPQILQ